MTAHTLTAADRAALAEIDRAVGYAPPRKNGRPAVVPNLPPLESRNDDDRITEEEVSAYTGYSRATLKSWRARRSDREQKGPPYQPAPLSGRGHRGYYLAGPLKKWVARMLN